MGRFIVTFVTFFSHYLLSCRNVYCLSSRDVGRCHVETLIILKHVYWALRHEYRSVLFRIRIF